MHCHVEGIRDKERREKRWIDEVQEDVNVYNFDTRIATYLVRDSARWRDLVSAPSSLND